MHRFVRRPGVDGVSVPVPAVGGVTRFRSRCDGSCVKLVAIPHVAGPSGIRPGL